MTHWSFAASAWIVVAGLAIGAAAAWLCYANWSRAGRRKGVAILELIRFALIAALLFTLLRPEVVKIVQRNERPEIVVLADATGSMNTRDIVLSNNVIPRADWVAGALKSEFWKPLEAGAKVTIARFGGAAATNAAAAASTAPASAPGTAAPGTDLDRALDDVLHREKNLKSVLLLSDGDWNMGKSPLGAATRFRDDGVPIYSVVVGQESPLPDLAVESVSAPSYTLIGEQVSIPFTVTSHLTHEVKTTISLMDGDEEAAKREVTIPPNGQITEAIVWSPGAPGDHNLKIKAPVQPDEVVPDNNEMAFRVAVRPETIKVLIVDSLPRWEYRYLRNALERDPGVEVHTILYLPGMAPGGGRDYLSSFPGNKEELSVYDVILLGDVGMGEGELSSADAELIKGLVQQQSSGLIFLPGPRGRELTFANSALADLYPVVLDSSKPEGLFLQNESKMQLTAAGANHLLTRFDADELLNVEIWKTLPGFYWSAAVEKSRPGSEVLGVHSDLRDSWGRLPLLVTRPSGNGKVLFMGVDSAWRWRRGVEDKYHYRFWSQVIRWMAHQRHLSEKEGIRLTYSPESPRAGETMFLQSTILDAAGFPLEQGSVRARVTAPSGRAEEILLSAVEGGWGVFKGSLVVTEGGSYHIHLSSDKSPRVLDTEIVVSQPQIEKIGQPVNAQVLREISQISQGASGGISALDQMVRAISVLPEAKAAERRTRLWSSPWWGAALLTLLCVYWIGRKLQGLV